MGETCFLKLTNVVFPFLNLLHKHYLQTTTYYVVLEKSPVGFLMLTLMKNLFCFGFGKSIEINKFDY